MDLLTVLAVTPAVYALCALAGWIYWLRLIRHVHDTSGADAIRTLVAAAWAYPGSWGLMNRLPGRSRR